MFSGTRGLGFPQHIMTDDEWYAPSDAPAFSDMDFIGAKYYSPDAGYPPQRIGIYDTQLDQHQTLNGLAAGTAQRFEKSVAPRAGFTGRAYAGNRPARGIQPRFSPFDISK